MLLIFLSSPRHDITCLLFSKIRSTFRITLESVHTHINDTISTNMISFITKKKNASTLEKRPVAKMLLHIKQDLYPLRGISL